MPILRRTLEGRWGIGRGEPVGPVDPDERVIAGEDAPRSSRKPVGRGRAAKGDAGAEKEPKDAVAPAEQKS